MEKGQIDRILDELHKVQAEMKLRRSELSDPLVTRAYGAGLSQLEMTI